MAELKSCPFCGGKAEIVKLRVSFSDINYDGYAIHAECSDCRAKSPYKRGEFYGQFREHHLQEAIEAWNRRMNE